MATKDLTVGALRRAFALNGLPLSRDEALDALGVIGAPDEAPIARADLERLARQWATDWSGGHTCAADVLRELVGEG